jgi:hypothetical protein
MGQCKSKDQELKSYANAVFRCYCCYLSASLSIEALKKLKRKQDSESKERDFKNSEEVRLKRIEN